MNDFATFEKTIVRELSCRLCLCNDVIKLKPLSAEVKRKIKKLFDISVRANDSLPKAICHDCLQQISVLHLFAVKIDKTQKFLEYHKMKSLEDSKRDTPSETPHPIVSSLPAITDKQQGDATIANTQISKPNPVPNPKSKALKKKSPTHKFLESLTLEEFANSEKVDKHLLAQNGTIVEQPPKDKKEHKEPKAEPDYGEECLDPVVLIDGRPSKVGAALDRQITLFYKMECCICHQNDFHFRSLMKHYKERHGVPGYVTCCAKKFHYFYPKKIIEHMAYHLQPNIFQCGSCHQNFQTSQELHEHQSNGGRSEGKIQCPRCEDRYPTYRELGYHIVTHRTEKNQCDYCGKSLKHHHRKKTINHMEDIVICYQCIRTLKSIEKQEKETKEKVKAKATLMKIQKEPFHQAMGLSGDEDGSTN